MLGSADLARTTPSEIWKSSVALGCGKLGKAVGSPLCLWHTSGSSTYVHCIEEGESSRLFWCCLHEALWGLELSSNCKIYHVNQAWNHAQKGKAVLPLSIAARSHALHSDLHCPLAGLAGSQAYSPWASASISVMLAKVLQLSAESQ